MSNNKIRPEPCQNDEEVEQHSSIFNALMYLNDEIETLARLVHIDTEESITALSIKLEPVMSEAEPDNVPEEKPETEKSIVHSCCVVERLYELQLKVNDVYKIAEQQLMKKDSLHNRIQL